MPASVLPHALTLDAKWYVSPEVFESEGERIFARQWICVGRADSIPNTGDFFLAEVAGESIILTRNERNEFRAFFNVCRHRGTRICLSARGHFRTSIQCPYHAWTYSLDGDLRAARNMDKESGFDRADYPLHGIAVAAFEGFLFVNLAAEPEPFEQAFAPLHGRFARWNPSALVSGHRITYDLACNWKLVFLNYSECYHCPLIHPQLEQLSSSESGRNDLFQGRFLGGYSELRNSHGTLSVTGSRVRAPLGEIDGADLARVYYYTIFPSLLLSLHADYVMAHYVTPLSVDKTRVVCEWLFDRSESQRDDFDAMDAVDFWDLTNRQDWNVNELTQRGVSSRAYTPGPYTEQEGLLYAFDRHYLSIMEA
ncbi:MAG: aromatic ring-hydroxylating dioxygenase subunit alpha [Candidatus Eremiobacteraeota bacterium]|nr:aromatic ring-hydroxylating dioxygenase subunit alpha [Candidatus Eremiobacteraeota bacterium]